MKKIDLDSALKAVRVPERDKEFWDDFPGRVVAGLRAVPPPFPRRPMAPVARPRWGLGLALASVAVALCLWQSRMPGMVCRAVLKEGKELRQSVRQFHGNVSALMLDEHGLRKLVEDQQ